MEDREQEQSITLSDLSGGVQSKTTEFLQKNNEQEDSQNSRYDSTGGIKRSLGYEKIGNDLTQTTSTSTSSSTTTTSTSTSTSTTSTSSSTSRSTSTTTT